MGGDVGYSRRNLFLIACSVHSLFIAVGIVMGWASPCIPKLKEEHFNITDSQYNLLGSIPSLGPGPLIPTFGIDTIGRKGTLLVTWSTIVISPIIMLITPNIYALLAARFISGLGMAAAFSAIGIYISEISDVRVRNALNSVSFVVLNMGALIFFCFTPFYSFFNINIFTLVASSIFGLFWYFIPETPYYFVGKGNTEKARSSLVFIKRGATSELIEKELAQVVYSVEEERRNTHGMKKLFTSKSCLKQLAISFYILYLQSMTGIGIFGTYLQSIFEKYNTGFRADYIAIGLTITTTIFSIPAPLLLKKLGSKATFMFGGFGTGSFMVLLGINCIYFAENDSQLIRCLPILLTFGCILSCYIGLGGSVWGMVSDLFAPSLKGLATGICGLFSNFMGFITNEIFGELKDHVGFGIAFVIFGVIQAISSIGLFFVVDTTKMSLQEIQDYFEKSSNHQKKSDNI